jgi:hypothetical protein
MHGAKGAPAISTDEDLFRRLVHQDRSICFGITLTGLSAPTAAHIHRGRRGKNGPILITLSAPSGGNPGTSGGCVDAAPELLSDIRRHPRRYYANVHTDEFPDGAVRGQLFQPTRSHTDDPARTLPRANPSPFGLSRPRVLQDERDSLA